MPLTPPQLPLIAAPMAGLTHGPFRRLLCEFGGCDTMHTEMLSAPAVRSERPDRSPWLRPRPDRGPLVYQLLAPDLTPRLGEAVTRILECAPAGLDLNCACPASKIRCFGGGGDIAEDPPRLASVLHELRRCFPGRLSVKLRLGSHVPDWEERFVCALRTCEDSGVDALTVNPRFREDMLSRPARLSLLPWIVAQTPLPVTANGDILGPETVAAHPDWFAGTAGLMLGRIMLVRPWVFAAWRGGAAFVPPDPAAVWYRLYDYIVEEFPPEKAIGRVKRFSGWFARNFVYGHSFHTATRGAHDLPTLKARADRFFATPPALVVSPCLAAY